MSPAVLCGGDFSVCFPLCFMSDSRCRMLMVISELRRQMKIQLKEGKVRLRSSLSSAYWSYQFPLQSQTRVLLSAAGRDTRRNSFTETQSHHKPHDKRVKPAWQKLPVGESNCRDICTDSSLILYLYLTISPAAEGNAITSPSMVSRISAAYLHPLTVAKLQPLIATTPTGKAFLMPAIPWSLCGVVTVKLMWQYFLQSRCS